MEERHIPAHELHEDSEMHPRTKSLTHTQRLRNLLDISVLLTSYESAAETIPLVLEKFAATLSLRSAVVFLEPDQVFTWTNQALPDTEAAEAAETARRSYRTLFQDTPEAGNAERRVQTTPWQKAGGAVSITLPLTTHRVGTIGVVVIIGYEFDEEDLLYFDTAVNQLSLAILRDLRIRSQQSAGEQKVTTAERARSEAESAQAEAERIRRLQEDLLAVVSHDLKNPLTSILINSELLTLTEGLDDIARIKVAAVRKSARQMQSLISDLLDWTKLDLGRLALQKESCRLDRLMADAVELMQPIIERSAVQLKTRVVPAAARVECDPKRILQVFSNLLGNAAKFTPSGGRILFAAAVKEREVVFSVTDSGPGIPANLQPHVFERLWQAPETAGSGAGLGLAIAKGLVEAHGGRIWLESEPGKGSTFFVALPQT